MRARIDVQVIFFCGALAFIAFFPIAAATCGRQESETSSTEPATTTAPSDLTETLKTVSLPPVFPSEESDRRVDVCDEIRPGEAIHLIVKGKADPPLPDGGFVNIAMRLDPGIKLVFLNQPRAKTYTGSDTIMGFRIPEDQTQQVLMLVRNTGNTAAAACLGLAYEYPPEPEPEPESKDGNDPPLPKITDEDATPRKIIAYPLPDNTPADP